MKKSLTDEVWGPRCRALWRDRFSVIIRCDLLNKHVGQHHAGIMRADGTDLKWGNSG